MRIRMFGLLTLAIFVGGVAALDFEMRATAGYGFSSGRDNSFIPDTMDQKAASGPLASYDQTQDPAGDWSGEYDDKYVSFGNGLKIDVEGAMYLNENLGIVLASGISFLGGAKIDQKSVYNSGNQTHLKLELDGNYLPILAGLRLKTELGPVMPYITFETGVFIPLGIKGEGTYEEIGQPNRTVEIEADLTAGFGISAAIGATLPVSDRIGICAEFAPTYAFARVEKITRRMIEPGLTITDAFVFVKDEADLLPEESSSNSSTQYAHGGPTLSFSSMAIKVGVVLSF